MSLLRSTPRGTSGGWGGWGSQSRQQSAAVAPGFAPDTPSASLGDTILNAARNPGTLDTASERASLVEAFIASGPDAAGATLDICVRFIKDQNESVQSKINMIRILDLLMGIKGDYLATQVVAQIKFFSQLAKLSKERDIGKRRPVGFSTAVDSAEVTEFFRAVCELLDKCGRRFENEDHKSVLYTFVKVRSQLQRDGVEMPLPQAYRHIGDSSSASPAAAGAPPTAAQGGSAESSKPLDNDTIERLIEEVRRAHKEHGKNDVRTADALARCESELALWQRAAEEAAENGKFAEFERLHLVAHRTAQGLQNLESGSEEAASFSGASTAAPPPASELEGSSSWGASAGTPSPRTWQASGDGDVDDSALNSSRSERKHRRKHHREKHGSVMDVSGGGDPWPMQGDGQGVGAGFGFGGARAGAPPEIYPPAQAGGPSNPFVDPSHFSPEVAVAGPGPGPGPPAERVPSGDVARCAQLEAQVQILQANNHAMQTELARVHEQLGGSLQRLRRLEIVEHDLAEARASLATTKDVNLQLQRELDRCQREFSSVRERMLAAEAKLSEQGGQVSEARQRVFSEQRKRAQLEDELESRAAMHVSMQNRLQEERDKHAATEQALFGFQHLFRASTPSKQEPRSNVPYGGQITTGDRGTDRMDGGSPRSAALKVNQSDELAASSEAPLQRLARRSREAGTEGATESVMAKPAHGAASDLAAPPLTTAVLASTPHEVWTKTPHVPGPPGVLTARTPPALPQCIERTCANYRSLLVYQRGPMYEDEHVVMEMFMQSGGGSSGSAPGRLRCSFDVSVTSRAGAVLQQVRLVAGEAAQYTYHNLKIQPVRNGASTARGLGAGSQLRPHEKALFHGEFEVITAYEAGPQAELSYLLPDNLCCRARFRLPLVVTRFMAPAQPSAARFSELWTSPDFTQAEVAFVCIVRRAFLDAGGYFFFTKCLELGGVLRPLSGLDSNPQSVVLASSYPHPRSGVAQEVLVHAELGSPRGEAAACRLSIRSASYMVCRGLAQVLMDALCDSPGCATGPRTARHPAAAG